jgi:hypothetical protein
VFEGGVWVKNSLILKIFLVCCKIGKLCKMFINVTKKLSLGFYVFFLTQNTLTLCRYLKSLVLVIFTYQTGAGSHIY